MTDETRSSIQLDYGYGRTLHMTVDSAIDRITETLKEQGFGVLSRIDVDEKLREKLNVNFRRYVILGACNPPIAYQSLQAEPNLGLLLPCNVVVYEDGSGTVVAGIDAVKMLSIVGNPALQEAAVQVNEKIVRAIDNI
jgi:uncharacterized protein (DUF302 family)